MLAYEVEGLKSLDISVRKWGSSFRVKVPSTKTGRMTYVTKLTPKINQALIKKYNIDPVKFHEALSIKTSKVKYKFQEGKNVIKHTYQYISESDFHDRLENIMKTQTTAYKINIALGYDCYNAADDEDFHYHPNMANTAIFPMPFTINTRHEIGPVFEAIKSKRKEDVIRFEKSAVKLRAISGYEVIIYPLNYSLGDSESIMPDIIKKNKHIINFPSTQNKCVFHCLAYHLIEKKPDPRKIQVKVKETFQKYCEFKNNKYSLYLYKNFKPLDILEFDQLEECFKVNIEVYTMDVETGDIERLRETSKNYNNTLNILSHENHALYITSIDKFNSKFQCQKCNTIFTDSKSKRNHIRNQCQRAEIQTFVKGPSIYRPKENLIKSMLRKYGIKGIDHYLDHFIVYDFEAILKPICIKNGDKTEFINQHIPVSVSISDSLSGLVNCLISQNPKKLLEDMFSYIREVSQKIYLYNVNKFENLIKYLSKGPELEAQLKRLDQILKQVPCIGFNSQKYDINLIRNELFAAIGPVKRVIKNPGYMCISTDYLKMLDITNYLPPGTSYSKYLETYLGKCKCESEITCTCNMAKGHFCYEYITSFDKLDEKALPPIKCFDSKLKNTKLSQKDYERLKFVWKYYEMKTVKDLLIWYNNLDVAPFILAIKEQRKFYRQFSLDIFGDGVSLPSLAEKVMYQKCFLSENLIKPSNLAEKFDFPLTRFNGYPQQDIKADREFSMTIEHLNDLLAKQHYLCGLCKCKLDIDNASADRINNKIGHQDGNILMTCIKCNCARKNMSLSAFRYQKLLEFNSNRLVHSIDEDNKDIYQKMKENIAGGPSIIFTRYAKRNETYIRDSNKITKKIIGYDANALYLWALGNEMPCGQLTTINTYDTIIDDIKSKKLFGFLECDIETPVHLKDYFSEMCPIFKNIEIDPKDKSIIGEHMFEYNESKGKSGARKSKKLISSYFGTKILIYTPLLNWYLEHGLVITKTYSFIKAYSHQPFEQFMEEITTARRIGDLDPTKKIIADMMKLTGNSAFGRSGMDKSKHKEYKYTTDQKEEDKLTNSFTFYHKEELDGSTEITLKMRRIKQNNPIHLSIAIYQLAKLRMLQFYYECIDKYIDRSDFEYLEMDTDSAYIAFSNEKPFENLVKPELKEDFLKHQYEWFPREDTIENNLFDKKTPGIFKQEWSGDAMISLSSKNYICYLPDEVYSEKNNKMIAGESKISSKGVQKSRNSDLLTNINFEKVILNKITLSGSNMGFRLCKETKSMITYRQHKTGLNYMYDKRQVLADGLHTIPLNI